MAESPHVAGRTATPLAKPHPQTPAPPRSWLPPVSLPFHPFPDELFSFFLLFRKTLGPQEPFGLILEGG